MICIAVAYGICPHNKKTKTALEGKVSRFTLVCNGSLLNTCIQLSSNKHNLSNTTSPNVDQTSLCDVITTPQTKIFK